MRAVRALAKDKKKFRGGTFLAALGGIYRLLDLLAPGSTLKSAQLMKARYSNFTHLVKATAARGELVRLVVRRYSDIYREHVSQVASFSSDQSPPPLLAR